MKATMRRIPLTLMLAAALSPALAIYGADTPEQAANVKEKIQKLRTECAETRRQASITTEELDRLTQKNVELRPQFEKFKSELVKMEVQAGITRARADAMKAKGQEFFSDWEQSVNSIQNPEIKKAAEKRVSQRKKSYSRILNEMQEAKTELVPFMSDLNDLKTLFDGELTANSVASGKSMIKQARGHGEDVSDSLQDVEKELDRVAAELAKYQ